jgi:hypothetical protein
MRKKLSPFWRCIYAKGQRKGLEVFEDSARYFQNLGYIPKFMSHLYKTHSHSHESSTEKEHPIE